jgi:hypothetical protein
MNKEFRPAAMPLPAARRSGTGCFLKHNILSCVYDYKNGDAI